MKYIKNILELFKSKINTVYDYDLIIAEQQKLKKGKKRNGLPL